MENWRMAWREGVAPQLSTLGLEALRQALEVDDERLVQGVTTSPPPLACMQNCGVEGACAVGFAAWIGDGVETVGAIEDHFARVCFETDRRLGEPTACRRFLNWYDDTPRGEMRRRLLVEVCLTLAQRQNKIEVSPTKAEAAA